MVASRRTWVDPDYLLPILNDDGFSKFVSFSEAQPGDVLVYRYKGEICHAGIVWRKNLFDPEHPRDSFVVLSKWGQEGEYLHDASDVPALCGQPSECWTDRKEVGR